MPVLADSTSVGNWTDLDSAIQNNKKETISLTQAISAAAGVSAITSNPTTQLMVNAMNGVAGTIEDVTLPTVKMGTTYIQYGLGCTKRIKDRLSMYGQVMFSNGVRTGVGFQGGLQWKL